MLSSVIAATRPKADNAIPERHPIPRPLKNPFTFPSVFAYRNTRQFRQLGEPERAERDLERSDPWNLKQFVLP